MRKLADKYDKYVSLRDVEYVSDRHPDRRRVSRIRILLLTGFYRSSVLEPFDTEVGIADRLEARLEVGEAALSYAALILNRRFKFRWATRFRLLIHVLLVHGLLIRFQLLGSLDVPQLLGDTQVRRYARSRCVERIKRKVRIGRSNR